MDKVLSSLLDSNVRKNRMMVDFVIDMAEMREGADLQPLIDDLRAAETGYADCVASMKGALAKGRTVRPYEADLERAHETLTRSIETLSAASRRRSFRR